MGFDLGWVDIALLVFLALSVGVGLVRGVVFELLALAGWFVAGCAARWLTPACQAYIHLGSAGSALNYGATFAAVFLAALLVWGLGARLVRALIRATPLSLIDRLLGAGFGMVRGIVVLLLLALLASVSPLGETSAWHDSHGALWLNDVLHELRAWLPGAASGHTSA
jgi:membrane protein required for colicin V production